MNYDSGLKSVTIGLSIAIVNEPLQKTISIGLLLRELMKRFMNRCIRPIATFWILIATNLDLFP